ncbi:MAG: anaerobic sulfatase maturase [Rhodobacteraceae bacterium]|nr:anaerobic sulfatase maturase [Paracoccaceae bacterium]
MPQPRPFNVIANPAGPRCNIACSYCYYLDKTALYPGEQSFRMPPDVLDRFVREMIAASQEAGMSEVFFTWQGGEPTLSGLAFFQEVVALQQRYRPAGVRISNALQTNGTLLDDAWGAFLKDHRFLVGLSIDGPRDIHDSYRRDRAGRPSFDAVMRGLDIVRRYEIEFGSLTTIHRKNAAKGKVVYRFLKGLGIRSMQFIPIVERTGPDGHLAPPPGPGVGPDCPVTGWSVAPRAYGKFLCDVFDSWFRGDVGQIAVQFFSEQVRLWQGHAASLCVLAETCGRAMALEHNGDLFACDHYVDPAHRLGNVMQTPLATMIGADSQHRFGQDKRDRLTRQCRDCRFLFACNGGCQKHRFATARDGESGHNYLCEGLLAFFQHAKPGLQSLALGVHR